MNSISNDFVTIEYDDLQKEKAEHCLRLFNREPEFYKGLLNGKTIIHSGELSSVWFFTEEDNDEIKEINKELVNKAIMKMNGVDDKWYPFHDRDNSKIYEYMMKYIHDNPNKSWVKEIEMTLAYDYFKKTEDFEYLEKYLYGDGITDDDIMDMCTFNIMEYYDDLLREKIHNDVLSLSNEEFITKDFKGIMSILMGVAHNVNSNFNYKNITPEELYEKLQNNPIPKIDDKQLEVLVRETLKYIDPTNELLDEYLKCRSENRIKEEMAVNGDEGSYFYKTERDYGIKLYKFGNITDVITLVHEFGHLHYANKTTKKVNNLFDEYPSIYYELKTAEYLKTVGYSEEDVHYAEMFRSCSNAQNLTYLIPIIQSVYINMGKEKEDYDLGPVKKMLDMYEQTINNPFFDSLPEEVVEQLRSQMEQQTMRVKWVMLTPTKDLSAFLKYMVGTYLAEDGINNLDHEEVLGILDTITQDEYSLDDVLRIQGLIPSSNKQDKPKEKEKIDDKDNEKTSE